jgi:hypothetical protein
MTCSPKTAVLGCSLPGVENRDTAFASRSLTRFNFKTPKEVATCQKKVFFFKFVFARCEKTPPTTTTEMILKKNGYLKPSLKLKPPKYMIREVLDDRTVLLFGPKKFSTQEIFSPPPSKHHW